MKNRLRLLQFTLIIFTIILIGCSGDDDSEDNTTPEPTAVDMLLGTWKQTTGQVIDCFPYDGNPGSSPASACEMETRLIFNNVGSGQYKDGSLILNRRCDFNGSCQDCGGSNSPYKIRYDYENFGYEEEYIIIDYPNMNFHQVIFLLTENKLRIGKLSQWCNPPQVFAHDFFEYEKIN